jgi:hypothetical protein
VSCEVKMSRVFFWVSDHTRKAIVRVDDSVARGESDDHVTLSASHATVGAQSHTA